MVIFDQKYDSLSWAHETKSLDCQLHVPWRALAFLEKGSPSRLILCVGTARHTVPHIVSDSCPRTVGKAHSLQR
jgi:hypothetical protein